MGSSLNHGFINQELKNWEIMKLLDKIEKFEAERKSAEENYRAFGVDREEHQKRMLEFIHKKMEEAKGR